MSALRLGPIVFLAFGCSPKPEEVLWYFDGDGDGHGASTPTQVSAIRPEGYAALDGDCDDGDAAVYPGAPELCDDVDQDCDGVTRDPDSVDATEWWRDHDGDSFGDPDDAEVACDPAWGAMAPGEADCDDGDDHIFPGAWDFCGDGEDWDCDGRDPVCPNDGRPVPTWRLVGVDWGADLGNRVSFSTSGPGDAVVLQSPVTDAEPGRTEALVVAKGSTGTLGPADAAAVIEGLAGYPTTFDGDGDGLGDVAGLACDDAGCRAAMWLGPLDADRSLGDADWTFGEDSVTVFPAPDVDGDGVGDLWVPTATYGSGLAADLVSGADLGGVAAPIAQIDMGFWWDDASQGILDIDATQDFDGDGVVDVAGRWIEGAEDSVQRVGLLFGPFSGTHELGAPDMEVNLGRYCPIASMAVGDLDGDGRPDLVAGRFNPKLGDTGSALVYLAPWEGEGPWYRADAAFQGPSRGAGAGTDVAVADRDGDGQADLIVSAPYTTEAGVYVVYGPLSSGQFAFVPDQRLWWEEVDANQGASLGAADLDGDGAAEVLVGAPGFGGDQAWGFALLLPGA